MKKIILLAIFLLASCAHQQAAPYVIPQYVKARSVETLYNKAIFCSSVYGAGTHPFVFINPGKEPNAWVDTDNKVHLTEGLFRFDDDTIAFVIAHEIAHAKLKHVRNRNAVSLATTGVFMIAGVFIPGIGLLNHAVNPAVANNYSKVQEYEADKLASETLASCFNIPVDKQVQILQSMQSGTIDAGGFWDQHPSWADRIENIKQTP